jgi:hypothetical protein
MRSTILLGVAATVVLASPAAAFTAPSLSPSTFIASRSAATNVAAKSALPSFGRKNMPLSSRKAATAPSMVYKIDLTGKVLTDSPIRSAFAPRPQQNAAPPGESQPTSQPKGRAGSSVRKGQGDVLISGTVAILRRSLSLLVLRTPRGTAGRSLSSSPTPAAPSSLAPGRPF